MRWKFMDTGNVLLKINQLQVSFRINDQYYAAVDRVSLNLNKNEILAIVGESGCGKSTLATAIVGLHNPSNTKIKGDILYQHYNLTDLTDEEFNGLRGKDIGFIFQDPLSALNPLMRIGEQIAEGLRFHTELTKQQQNERVLELLEQVGIADVTRVVRQFPHQLSGGMRQRVMIAIALACKPAIIIADEPTTALDVTIQAQIVDLLKTLQDETEAGILLITHDLGVVAEIADRVAVMYAGQVVEMASVHSLFTDAKHPYTRSLLNAIPQSHRHETRLKIIQGMVPSLTKLPRQGCRFATRMPWINASVHEEQPALYEVTPGHFVRCTCWQHFYFEDEQGRAFG